MSFNVPVLFYSSLALIAFAANSVLCRMALGGQTIDAMSFTLIRLLSGSVMLILLVCLFERNNIGHVFRVNVNRSKVKKSPIQTYALGILGPLFLFIYAAGFSYAYVSLDTGIGALILFAVVQITMIMVIFIRGNRLNLGESVGLLVGFLGFVYLLYPSLTGPSLYGLILMSLSGVAWGGYSILGQSKNDQIVTHSSLVKTANNFVLSLPFALFLLIIMFNDATLSLKGVLLSSLAGAITSGLGYAIWYKALLYLTTTRAAVAQLLVPVLASVGGLLFLNELLTLHLIVSSIVVLGGILIVVLSRKQIV